MNINELSNRLDELNLDGYKHIKKNEWDDSDKLKDWLMSKNFKKAGEGGYATVYVSETENFVVKVNDGHFDNNYVDFINFCHRNKSNQHLPKIGQIKKLSKESGDKWFVVFIEKLEPFDIRKVFGVEPNEYEKILDFFFKLINKPSKISNKDVIKQLIESGLSETQYTNQLADIGNTVHDFCDQYSIDPKDFLDMHDDNLMMRGNTIVVIDPVAS